MTGDQDGYVTVRFAAEYFDVIPLTIYRWIKAGRIPFVRLGTRTVRVKITDQDAGTKQAESAGKIQAAIAGEKQAESRRKTQAKYRRDQRKQKRRQNAGEKAGKK